MKKNTKKNRGGNSNVYENILTAMNNLKNDVNKLGIMIEKVKNKKENLQNDNTNTVNEIPNEIPNEILNKIKEEQQEMNKVLESVDKKEEQIEESKNEIKTENNQDDKRKLEESKEELKNNIESLTEKINDGLEDNILFKNKQRNRSFYSTERTWNQWFYGFVEYYDELKGSLKNIIENKYYNNILQKSKSHRTPTENVMIEKVNNLEIELNNMNKNIIKGGYKKKRLTRKKSKNNI